jgi:hypothetical protein
MFPRVRTNMPAGPLILSAPRRRVSPALLVLVFVHIAVVVVLFIWLSPRFVSVDSLGDTAVFVPNIKMLSSEETARATTPRPGKGLHAEGLFPPFLESGHSDPAASDRLTVRFCGINGFATRVLYIVDISGSMTERLPEVLRELRSSINDLDRSQQFLVLFYGRRVVECEPWGWKLATDSMKETVRQWMDLDTGHIVPAGHADPIPAFLLAGKMQPQIIFWITDAPLGSPGPHEIDREALIQAVEAADPLKKIRVNTVELFNRDPLVTLQQVAGAHDGRYAHVTLDDLLSRPDWHTPRRLIDDVIFR